jgi:hypothetical protein
MTIKHLFPEAWPTLNLDFANSKALDPRITFTRSSIGTYVDAEGIIQTAADDEPRFDHDPETGESLGLLIEESRTNLEPDSEGLDTWGATECSVTPNVTIAPDGTATADKFVPNVGTVRPWITSNFLGIAGVDVTFSIYAKADVYDFLQLASSTGFPSRVATFDLVNGLVTYFSTSSATIEPLKDGWYRCSITQESVSTNQNFLALGAPSDPGSNRLPTYTAVAGDGLFLWGAQAEQGSFSTSYIATSGSTVTRSADIASITGTNFSSWYNQNQGTVLSTFKSPVPEANSRYWLLISDGANSLTNAYRFEMERITATTSNGSNAWSSTGDLLQTGYTKNAENRTAFGYDRINNFNIFSNNGVIQGTNNSATDVDSVPTTVTIGAAAANKKFSGHISRFAYYPIRLPDEQLQALTT